MIGHRRAVRSACRAVACWAVLGSVAGCSDDLTQLMLVLDTELDVPDEASSLRVQVTGASGRTYEATAELAALRPATLALVAPPGESGGDVSVIVEVQRDGVRVASRSVATSFVEGHVKAVPVCVSRACTTSCPEQSAPGAAMNDWSGTPPMPCALPADPDAGVAGDGATPPPPPDSLGQVLFVQQLDGTGIFLNRIEIREGAAVERLSDVYEATFGDVEYPDDRDGALSPDGRWTIAKLGRGECSGWGCFFIGPSDEPAAMSPVRVRFTADTYMHELHPVVGNDADLIVWEGAPAVDGHEADLWLTRLVDEEWTMPVALTGASTYPFNKMPRLSPDQRSVVFSCSTELYSFDRICEVAIDGTGYREVLAPDRPPSGVLAEDTSSLDSPRYEPDGSILFAAAWTGRQLWRLRPGADEPERVLGPFDEDLSQPCVLPSGHVLALRGSPTSPPAPTIDVFDPDGQLLMQLDVDYVEGQYTWINDCGPP